MDKRAIEALRASIKHWEANLADPAKATFGKIHCALCQEFHRGDNGCGGCPVAAKTGEDYCNGSPYENATVAHVNWYMEKSTESRLDDYRKAAQAELDFLKSLQETPDAKT